MKYDLEDRLIDFAVQIVEICENMKESRSANHLGGQLIRSGTSPSLNYGEAQGGESRKDFIHKLKIALKELRETYACLRIISRCHLCLKEDLIKSVLSENNELIAIFVKSTETARKNLSSYNAPKVN